MRSVQVNLEIGTAALDGGVVQAPEHAAESALGWELWQAYAWETLVEGIIQGLKLGEPLGTRPARAERAHLDVVHGEELAAVVSLGVGAVQGEGVGDAARRRGRRAAALGPRGLGGC